MDSQPPRQNCPDCVPLLGGAGCATRLVTTPAGDPGVEPVPPRRDHSSVDIECLQHGIVSGDRSALARAITLIESRAERHRVIADQLISRLLPGAKHATRVGISGVPGAGKSTFIDTLGLLLVKQGRRVAVLSVDPSSPVSGGSILGDKTRMERLAREPSVFIRPSPSGGMLGGVARRTRESICLCEAAGFDVVLVETVGVGQSEVVVRSMVDCFVVLTIAGAGDELQGMKKGILELAQLVVVNKADGENQIRANSAALELERALRYLDLDSGDWRTRVMTCSSRTGENVELVWTAVEDYISQASANGRLDGIRREQNVAWMDELLGQMWRQKIESDDRIRELRSRLESKVAEGKLPAPQAAENLFSEIVGGDGPRTFPGGHNRDALFDKKRGVATTPMP